MLTLFLLTAMVPATSAFHQGEPVVLELTGDAGDAWAVAVRSHDEPTSIEGNEVMPVVQIHGPLENSIGSMGILQLIKDEDGERFEKLWGGVGAVFGGENEVHVEPVGGIDNPASLPEVQLLDGGDDGDPIVQMAERRSMDPGEWRYFVAWAGGSESSTFQLRGEGFTVEKIVHGEGYALGNDELVNGGGIHAQKSHPLPQGVPQEAVGHLGAGATVVSDTGVTLQTQVPLLGVFTEFHTWEACTYAPFSGCFDVGDEMNGAVSAAEQGGFSNFSVETPDGGENWNRWNLYWLTPGWEGTGSYPARAPGTYRFLIDHLVDASGPSYREPFAGHAARLDGEQLVLSLAKVDYTKLEAMPGS